MRSRSLVSLALVVVSLVTLAAACRREEEPSFRGRGRDRAGARLAVPAEDEAPRERATPVQVKDLLDPRLSLATAILAVLGVSAWVAGIALMVPRLATSGATALFAGVALMLGQIHPLTKRIHS